MKIAPVRVLSLLAACAALAVGCESDYDKLNEDIYEPGWGVDAGGLPTCVVPAMDASSGGGADTGTGSDSSASGDSAANGDSATNGDSGANGDSETPDSGTPDAGEADAGGDAS